MAVLFVLISICLVMALIFLAAFIWSVKSGQYDDDYTPSVRILFDEPTTKSDSSKKNPNNDRRTF